MIEWRCLDMSRWCKVTRFRRVKARWCSGSGALGVYQAIPMCSKEVVWLLRSRICGLSCLLITFRSKIYPCTAYPSAS